MNTLLSSMDAIDYLQISLIIEKILGRTSLSWTEILAPTWVGAIITIISLIILLVIASIIHRERDNFIPFII